MSSSAPFGIPSPEPDAILCLESESGAGPVSRAKRHHKRAEDTGVGCRANAAADLARARAPGGDYMRQRLEHSAAIWTERATLLERLERKFAERMHAI